MLREVDVSKLSVGMFVAELDRPWLDTPFPLQGFYIRSPDDVVRLAEYCARVFVDPRRYDSRLQARARVGSGWSTRIDENGKIRRFREKRLPEARIQYDDTASMEEELPAAREAFDTSASTFKRFWDEITAKRRVPIAEIRRAIDPLVDSILRNKDALVALIRVQRIDPHTHEHCLAMAVWAGLIGRQLGLPQASVRKLALGCSLVDIGMVQVPRKLLEKADEDLSDAERSTMDAHVQHSVDLLAQMGETDDDVSGIVRWHHERMDGTGFPDALSGKEIPMFARIAGIVDSYDAMISPRTAFRARSSFEALMELQDLCPAKYQSELVEQFAQAVGIFPNGCLVELSTGEVAVVFSQNTGRRLRPKVMLILDEKKQRRDKLVVVDLQAEGEQSLRISRELPHGEYGIEAREYFL